jgi:Flp pilus assembly protein TadG
MSRRLGQRRRGSAAVEFALVLPVLLLLFGAIVDFSLYVSTCHVVSRAARDGARVGAATPDPSGAGTELRAAAIAQAQSTMTEMGHPCSGGCTVNAEWTNTDGYWWLSVEIEYDWTPPVGVVPGLQDGITQRFVMMTQQQS